MLTNVRQVGYVKRVVREALTAAEPFAPASARAGATYCREIEASVYLLL